jgi:hypothetical protein
MKNFTVIGLLCLLSSNASAMPKYLAKFKTTYPAAKALHNCQTCHNSNNDRNDFAKDFAANGHDFKAIEGFDSDVDGFTNLVEISAGTKPGSRDSHPSQSIQ